MTATVVITPDVTELEIVDEPVHLTIEAEETTILLDFECSQLAVMFDQDTQTIEVDPIDVTLETEETNILIQSDIAPGAVGGGTAFLPVSDNIDESDSTYFYFGWEVVSGSWLIRRQTRSTSLTVDATIDNNPGKVNLTAAWTDRAALTYA